MRVAIDCLNVYSGGGVKAAVILLQNLPRVDRSGHYLVIVAANQENIIAEIPTGFSRLVFRHIPANPFLRTLWGQVVLPFHLWRHRVEVLYSVGNSTVLLAPCKVVLFLENATPFSPLQMEWPLRERLRNTFIRGLALLAAKKARAVRFCSDNSRRLIAGKLGLKAERCFTIPHACPPVISDAPSQPSPHRCSYILGVGIVGPTKNWETLLYAFGELVQRFGYAGDLVIVGNTRQFPTHTHALQRIVLTLGLEDRVFWCGFIANEELPRYYQNAEVFVMSSIEDTFGIPVVEAMGCGAPIAAADGDLYPEMFIPFREICAAAADYFDPFDAAAMAASIQRIIGNADYRRRLAALGREQSKRFSPEDLTEMLVSVFRATNRG